MEVRTRLNPSRVRVEEKRRRGRDAYLSRIYQIFTPSDRYAASSVDANDGDRTEAYGLCKGAVGQPASGN